jgi:hypothetical protein
MLSVLNEARLKSKPVRLRSGHGFAAGLILDRRLTLLAAGETPE